MAPIKGDSGGSGLPDPAQYGVLGVSGGGYGVAGLSAGQAGVYGRADFEWMSGVSGFSEKGIGVSGESKDLYGVRGYAPGDRGLGVLGTSVRETGVHGDGGNHGVVGNTRHGTGVKGQSAYEYGVRGLGGNIGVYAVNYTSKIASYLATKSRAGDFYGDIVVHNVIKRSASRLLLDHPLDPANKCLSHSSVESSDQKNLYDGIAVLDSQGEAQVELPEWFAALNHDLRYQLTCIGEHASVFVAQEVEGNQFRIAGGRSGLKVSWQVTGIRQDPWAKANPLVVEEEKPEKERGTFFHPELYGQLEERSVRWARYSRTTDEPENFEEMRR